MSVLCLITKFLLYEMQNLTLLNFPTCFALYCKNVVSVELPNDHDTFALKKAKQTYKVLKHGDMFHSLTTNKQQIVLLLESFYNSIFPQSKTTQEQIELTKHFSKSIYTNFSKHDEFDERLLSIQICYSLIPIQTLPFLSNAFHILSKSQSYGISLNRKQGQTNSFLYEKLRESDHKNIELTISHLLTRNSCIYQKLYIPLQCHSERTND